MQTRFFGQENEGQKNEYQTTDPNSFSCPHSSVYPCPCATIVDIKKEGLFVMLLIVLFILIPSGLSAPSRPHANPFRWTEEWRAEE